MSALSKTNAKYHDDIRYSGSQRNQTWKQIAKRHAVKADRRSARRAISSELSEMEMNRNDSH